MSNIGGHGYPYDARRLNFMNETLIELARVVKGGGRAALALSDVVLMRKSEELVLTMLVHYRSNGQLYFIKQL